MTENGLSAVAEKAAGTDLIGGITCAGNGAVKDGSGTAQVRSNILSGLDGIRAVACLGVIFHHFAQKLSPRIRPAFIRETGAFLLMGNSGVSVFFVLSGFLLSYPFWKRFLEGGEFPGMKQYALRRAARIVPGYYVSFLVSSLLIPVFHLPTRDFWIRVLTGMTFTAGFSYRTFFPNEINGPFWSVSFEVFCYMLMPVFMYLMFRIIREKRTLPKALAFWAGAAVLIAVLNQLIHTYLTPDNFERGWQFGMTGGAKYWMPNYNPIGFFGHFLIGIMASGIAVRLFMALGEAAGTIDASDTAAVPVRALGKTDPGKLVRFRKRGGFDIICILGLLGSFALLWFLRRAPEFSYSFQNQPYFFPFFALLIGMTLIAAPHSVFMGKLLDNAFFRFTAKVSFGLYIWHYLIMFIAANTVFGSYQNFSMTNLLQWALISLVVLAASYGAAALSYKFIEKPVLDRAHQWTGKSRSNSAGGAKANEGKVFLQ